MAISEPQALDPGRRRASTRLAWWLFAVGFIALVAAFVLSSINARPTTVSDFTGPLGFLAIALAGLAIAARRPENAVGWLFLGVWVGIGFMFGLSSEYGYWATVTHPGAPGGPFVVWLGNWTWVPIFGVVVARVVRCTKDRPDGRPF